jgi:hypothetical protein
MLYHEHEMVQRQTGGLLPPLDRAAVLADLGRDLRWVDHPAIKVELRRLLRAHGWNGVEETLLVGRPAWNSMLREWIYRALTWMRGRTPASITGFSYISDEQAIRADLEHPRPPQADTGHLAPLNPAELGIG